LNSSTFSCFGSFGELDPSARALLEAGAAQSLFASAPWFRTFIASGLPAGSEPAIFVLSGADGVARAILPCERLTAATADRGPGSPAIASLTSFYSCDFMPVLGRSPDPAATAFALGQAASRALTREPIVRFDSLDPTRPVIAAFLAGLRTAGRVMLRYDHFGRWTEDLGSSSFDDYLGGREGALREIIRRRGARLAREGAHLTIVDRNDIAVGIKDYEAVYARSWKEPEPFPDFQPALMRSLAEAGWLRLALCRLGDRPIAAQLWVVLEGRATVLKLAHDREFDRQSPGTVLTSFAIRTLMERDRITMLDFGRGDDPYKRAWTSRRTQHIGVLWAHALRRPAMVARHLLGAAARRLRQG
jgi:hypothetical protein